MADGVGSTAELEAGGAPANCDVMAEARSLGSNAVICAWIALIVGWASDAPVDAADPELNAIAGDAPTVDGSTGAPANCDVITEARPLGNKAVICAWIASMVGWASDGPGIDVVLVVIE